MIYFFSGTGNSRYVAEKLGDILHSRVLSILEDKKKFLQPDCSDNMIVIVVPIHSWGIPPIVKQYIEEWDFNSIQEIKNKNIRPSFVVTCGDDTGDVDIMIDKLIRKIGIKAGLIASVIMPNTYVLLPGFNVDSRALTELKIKESTERIAQVAEWIRAGREERDIFRGRFPGIKTKVVYPLFHKWGIDTKKFHADDKCIGCGKCKEQCPVGNIVISKGHPIWNNQCTSCLACFHICPTKAISYGKVTKNKGQYNILDYIKHQ